MKKGDKIKVPRSNMHREKLSLAMKGNKNQEKKRSEITKQKIARALNNNKNPLGYKHSKEMKRKCAIAKFGNNNPAWQGGISYEPYSLKWTKEIKKKIKERDKYNCQNCHKSYLLKDKELYIHHIDYDKKNCSLENLISLCLSCHGKTNHNREHWQKYFNMIINKSWDGENWVKENKV
jgi:hypothetical protein